MARKKIKKENFFVRSKITISLILICVLVFIIQTSSPSVTYDYSLTPSEASQKPYTLITSVFLHGSLDHLLFNMIALLIFGSILESVVRWKKFLFIFLGAGVLANLLEYLTTSNLFIPSLGASGAIYGIIGAAALMRPKQIIYFRGLPVPLIIAAGAYAVIEFMSLGAEDLIGHSVHLIGLIYGVFIGFLLLNSGLGDWGKKKFELIQTEKILIYSSIAIIISSLVIPILWHPGGFKTEELVSWAPAYIPEDWKEMDFYSEVGEDGYQRLEWYTVFYSTSENEKIVLSFGKYRGFSKEEFCLNLTGYSFEELINPEIIKNCVQEDGYVLSEMTSEEQEGRVPVKIIISDEYVLLLVSTKEIENSELIRIIESMGT